MKPSESPVARWSELLAKAVTEPGVIHSAYTRFHGYSFGNQMLAMFQCSARGIAPGPIATFVAWKDVGRFVKKGEKAICLCMPITCKGPAEDGNGDQSQEATTRTFTRFIYKNNWFVLSQTDGSDYEAPALPNWDEATALKALDITRVEFVHSDGNCQGYASGRSIGVSPVAALPYKTLFHEMAHVLLGHTSERLHDGAEITPRDIRELEAECVAMICCESLGLPGAEYSRGYIQGWYKGGTVPENSAQRIFRAADQVLKAGSADAPEEGA